MIMPPKPIHGSSNLGAVLRDSVVVAQESHTLQVVGSIPTPAF